MDSFMPSQPSPVMQIAAIPRDGLLLRRIVGCLVDLLVLALFLLIPDVVLGNELYQKTLLIWLVLLVAYFPVTEALSGRTLGKVVAGTKVVTADGQIPSLGKVLIRTLFRVLEVNPFLAGGIPAGIAVLASKYHQRLGDMVAHTYVLRVRDLKSLPPATHVPGDETAPSS